MYRRKYITGLGSLAIAGVAGCAGNEEPADTGNEEPEDTGNEASTDGEVVEEVDPENVPDHQLFEQYQNARATHVEDDEYAVAVEALEYIYRPGGTDPIEVPENSVVTFYLASRDTTHAFTLEEKEINAEIPPGEIVAVTVEFTESEDRTEYEITCGEEFCTDHDSEAREAMVGAIEVLSSWKK